MTDNRTEHDAALAAVERVRAIHSPGRIIDVWGKSVSQADDFLVCEECTDPDHNWCPWPCPTIAALDGAAEPEWEWAVSDQQFDFSPTRWLPLSGRSEAYVRELAGSHGRRVARRRKAGPWLPIEKEQDDA